MVYEFSEAEVNQQLNDLGLKITSVEKPNQSEWIYFTLEYQGRTMQKRHPAEYPNETLKGLLQDMFLFDCEANTQSFEEWIEAWEFQDERNDPVILDRYLDAVKNVVQYCILFGEDLEKISRVALQFTKEMNPKLNNPILNETITDTEERQIR